MLDGFRDRAAIPQGIAARIFARPRIGVRGTPAPGNFINGVPGPFAPIFVDTGNIPARNFQLFDPAFNLILGPVSLQSE